MEFVIAIHYIFLNSALISIVHLFNNNMTTGNSMDPIVLLTGAYLNAILVCTHIRCAFNTNYQKMTLDILK